MNSVAFDPDARAEFLAAVEYYEQCQCGLGRRFQAAVAKELKAIQTMPARYRVVDGRFRRCLVSNFPYALLFVIEPEYILVVAVAHLKRKPGYWLDRTTNAP